MTVPDLTDELSYRAVRGTGPGGQHVNKVATKVELRWSLVNSAALTEGERDRLSAKLAARLNRAGELVLTDQSTRSQSRNREVVTERFYAVLSEALRPQKRRKRTKPTNASKRERLQVKRKRSDVKKGRGRVDW